MRCAASKIKAANIRATVAGLKCPEKMPVTCQTINGATEHMITAINVSWRQHMFADDPRFEVPHSRGALQLLENHPTILREHPCPVVTWTKIRRMHQHIEGFSARERHGGIGCRWSTYITGGVGSRLAVAIDCSKLPLGIARKDKIVMEEMMISFFQAEVEDDTRAGRFILAPLCKCRGRRAAHQVAIGSHRIAV